MTRKKQTARERGYASRLEIATALRDMAKQVESLPDQTLVKFNINFWYTEDDELPMKEHSPNEHPR